MIENIKTADDVLLVEPRSQIKTAKMPPSTFSSQCFPGLTRLPLTIIYNNTLVSPSEASLPQYSPFPLLPLMLWCPALHLTLSSPLLSDRAGGLEFDQLTGDAPASDA